MWWLCRMPVTATVCGVGPDCRELAPWHQGGEDYKVLKRAYDAVTLRGGTPTQGGSSSSSTSPRTMVHTALDQQCSTLLPPLLDGEKEILRDAIDQELHMLVAGAQRRLVGWSSLEAQDGGVDNTQRDIDGLCAVVLDSEWACLEVSGWGSYSLVRLSSIQLETCWASFDATLVFGGLELLDARGSDESTSQEQPQQPEALRFAFDQLKRRLLFVLVMRLLQEVAQRKRFRRQSARRKSKSSPKKRPGSKGSLNRASSKNSTSAAEAPQSAGTPVESTPTSLAPGVFAKLHGLTTMSDLNGKYVILDSFDEASGRWHVKMTTGGDTKSVKPENLLVASRDESADLVRRQTSQASSVNEETSCVVCIAAPAVMAFVPCGHRCICIGCAAQLHGKLREKCPQCRCAATDIIRIFV